ncbi:MAG: glycosyltransferase family 4 protein [Sphaerochaeta sp.]|nr:glycosyltransferase family 4 protein [Sphaerochaeta sp.]
MRESLNIGMVHFKTGDTDGVSLEMDKWREIFLASGHKVYYCCGERPLAESYCTVIPALSYLSEETCALDTGTFDSLEGFGSEGAYEEALLATTQALKKELLSWVDRCSLNILIVENIWSVGLHPAAAIALDEIARQRKLAVLAHHHDFYWERVVPVRLTCKRSMEVCDRYLPPHSQGYVHVVINSKAQKALAERKGIHATVIPNVFDFSEGPWEKDAFNGDFRQVFGIADSDVLLLQATRVVRRKGIELAVDFAQALQQQLETQRGLPLYNGEIYSDKSRVFLVLCGTIVNDGGQYLAQLQKKAAKQGVNLLWIGNRIGHTRSDVQGRKTYSLWDAYAHADMVTYPSYWEGWGNQLLEAVRAKLPVALFPYEIYRSDIAPSGFSMIELGKSESLQWDERGLAVLPQAQVGEAAREASKVLFDTHARSIMVDSNFMIGQKTFSMESLRLLLEPFMAAWSRTLW